MVSIVKSRWAITGTMDKLKTPAITNRGHCISGTATPSANDATLQLCAAHDRRRTKRSLNLVSLLFIFFTDLILPVMSWLYSVIQSGLNIMLGPYWLMPLCCITKSFGPRWPVNWVSCRVPFNLWTSKIPRCLFRVVSGVRASTPNKQSTNKLPIPPGYQWRQ